MEKKSLLYRQVSLEIFSWACWEALVVVSSCCVCGLFTPPPIFICDYFLAWFLKVPLGMILLPSGCYQCIWHVQTVGLLNALILVHILMPKLILDHWSLLFLVSDLILSWLFWKTFHLTGIDLLFNAFVYYPCRGLVQYCRYCVNVIWRTILWNSWKSYRSYPPFRLCAEL